MTGLTDIDIDYPLSTIHCVEVMEQCPRLVRCEFRLISESAHDLVDDPHALITLLELRALSIHATEPLAGLFDCLTLPSLTMLKVVDNSIDSDFRVWSQSSFNSFMARSKCSVLSLHLLNALPSEEDLIQCLQWTSNSLTELRLLDLRGITVVMDRALAYLTVQEESGGVSCSCPKLEVLKLGPSLASTDGVLATMVESRWSPKWTTNNGGAPQQVCRLRSINPRVDAQTHPEDIRRLAILRLAGLELL